ncbi:histidine--tRNA ligase [Natranaerobius trueperi]|uniref:Histidine--tRNA ligase n=1 Tax=Natranaerobius trueperi TaxID=759412 RepID=A0A226BZ71_9FIRM|nr:histidine--tRNA ligase [Natranaerobius trueperi]OWZ83407.1 histidine--tRNA ligase [Natranaerobius trueperi]
MSKLKGIKDYSENELRHKIKTIIEKHYRRYGFESVETSVLTPMDVLTSKYGGGAEILEEIYRLTDRGDRDLGLRFDLTVPLMKVLREKSESIRKPFKRYEIGKVFRDGPTKKGRLREFTQCDADIVGCDKLLAEVELINMVLDIFEEVGLSVKVKVNNRKILEGYLTSKGIEDEKIDEVILTIDKLEKLEFDTLVKELIDKGLSEQLAKDTLSELTDASYDDLKSIDNQIVQEGLSELSEVTDYIRALGREDYILFTPTLARGLNFYDGLVYEVFTTEGNVTSSIAAGGRYNKGVREVTSSDSSAVGISIGLDVVYELLKDETTTNRDGVLVIPLGKEYEIDALKIATTYRSKGYLAEVEKVDRSIGKSFKYADRTNKRYAIVIGEQEVKENKVTVKDLKTGEELVEPLPNKEQ